MYHITEEMELMPIDSIMFLLKQSYWAANRSETIMLEAIKNSINIGVLFEGCLVAYARVVTDYATVFWLCDVVVDEKHRSKGLGKMMMAHIQKMDLYKPLKGILATADAHSLYEQYGFKKEPNKMMSKDRET